MCAHHGKTRQKPPEQFAGVERHLLQPRVPRSYGKIIPLSQKTDRPAERPVPVVEVERCR
jgi:hypothetical protein